MSKLTYYYIGTKKQMTEDLRMKNREDFLTEREMKEEYNSRIEMEEEHGKRYIQKIRIYPKNWK